MKYIASIIPALFLLVLPLAASAHEHAVFKIGNSSYQFVIGSLNEPIIVDDKSGVDLTVSKCATAACSPTMGEDGDMDGPVGPAVEGLEDTLKVEVQAGGQKKTLDLSPQYGKEGAYYATFYPTAATTYAYRVFGTVEGTPVDLTFTCLPAGQKAADDMTAKQISDGVTQTMIGGGFGCPSPKESFGFPDAVSPAADLAKRASSAGTRGNIALALGAAALVIAGLALRKKTA